jgi:hypothetical protein
MTKPHSSTPRVVPQQHQTVSRIKSPKKLRHSTRLNQDAEALKNQFHFLNDKFQTAKPAVPRPKRKASSSRDRNEHAEVIRVYFAYF